MWNPLDLKSPNESKLFTGQEAPNSSFWLPPGNIDVSLGGKNNVIVFFGQ